MSIRTRSRSGARKPTFFVLGLTLAAGLLLFPFSALANHAASDFFIFSKAEFGKFSELNCNSSNDKQADVSGSGNEFRGRIHSHADLAVSGSGNDLFGTLTFGKHDNAPPASAPDCQQQAVAQGAGGGYHGGLPTNIVGNPTGLGAGGWPGDLGTYLNQPPATGAFLQFGNNITQVLGTGAVCNVGSLTGTSDITLTAANNNQVVCNGTGKIQLNISGSSPANPLVRSLTLVSHGAIEISGQNVRLSPHAHGILAWTDQQSSVNDVSIKLAGSNFDIPRKSILFSPRSGQDVSGSDGSSQCVQLIGQGRIKVGGSNSQFGPIDCLEPEPALNQPAISTNATASVTIGSPISDSATLSNMAAGGTGGSITFRAYGPNDPNCTGTAAFTSSAFTANANGTFGPASFTPTTAGTYRWIASFGGNTTNLSVAGACNDANETSIVDKAEPGITTDHDPTIARFGDALTDTATLSGFHGSSPGNVTFHLYGPDDATCEGLPVFSSAATAFDANGFAETALGYELTEGIDATGTYNWVAIYDGNVNNEGISSLCGDEPVRVIDPEITITKDADSTQYLEGDLVTFTIVVENTGDSDLADVFVTDIVAPDCDRTKDSLDTPGLALMEPGDKVEYTCTMLAPDADVTNVANATGTPETGDDVTDDDDALVNVIAPLIDIEKTVEDDTLTVGETAKFTITVTNTGDVDLENVAVTDEDVPGCARDADAVRALIDDQIATGQTVLKPTESVEYLCELADVQIGFEGNTAEVCAEPPIGDDVCDEDTVPVVVAPAKPTVTTDAGDDVVLGEGDLVDTATLAGGYNPTGTITFDLYGPDDEDCSGPAIFTDTATVNGNDDYESDPYTPLVAGTYRWIANYGGDTNNEATANECNEENENVVVGPAPSGVTTAQFFIPQDTATVTGVVTPTGNVTFELFDNATCDGDPLYSEPVALDGNGEATTSNSGDPLTDGFTATAEGTYYWRVSYEGDANNQPSESACGVEVFTIDNDTTSP